MQNRHVLSLDSCPTRPTRGDGHGRSIWPLESLTMFLIRVLMKVLIDVIFKDDKRP